MGDKERERIRDRKCSLMGFAHFAFPHFHARTVFDGVSAFPITLLLE